MPSWPFGSIRQRVLVLFVAIVFIFTLLVDYQWRADPILVDDLVDERALNLVEGQSHIISLWLNERPGAYATRQLRPHRNARLGRNRTILTAAYSTIP